MKKIIALLLCIMICTSFVAFADETAEEIITVMINGEKLVTDVNPQLVNDRTMVPMRAIFEALGANVTWFEEDQLIFATKGDTMIVLQIDNPKLSIQTAVEEGVAVVELETAPYLYNSRTLVPVRAVSEALKANVEWVGETNTVVITK